MQHHAILEDLEIQISASSQSLPSPDGLYIATILSSKLSVRKTRSLENTRVITLPPELISSIVWFLWSQTSRRILIASPDNLHVVSATNNQFSAHIVNPSSGLAKITYVTFGHDEDEVVTFLDFGLKVSIHNLLTAKSVDISSPKFYSPATASKGFLYRPGTGNLTLLTRVGGKDVISVHARDTLEVVRSWWPDTIDAQGLSWSADGRWLVVCESASQGHKIVIYTADGHLYRAWNGPVPVSEEEVHVLLGAGIKTLAWSENGAYIALGDYGRRITLLSVPSFTEAMSMQHTMAVEPADSLHVWQESIIASPSGGFVREFVLATQAVLPPTSANTTTNNADPKLGTSTILFDSSSSFLATRTEELPTTIWIWDVGTRILRAVLILHAPIAKAIWHPMVPELLLIRCDGEESRGLVHLWDPSWQSPRIVDFATQVPGGKVIGKTTARWLNIDAPHPAIYFSDTQDCILGSLSDSEESLVPWNTAANMSFDISARMEESPLDLVPAAEKRPFRKVVVDNVTDSDEGFTTMRLSGESGSEEIEDTFQFRRFVEP